MNEILDSIWNRVVGGLDWLKQVIIGEFDDNRDMSAVIADMLLSFVPGVIIVTSARDLTAVIVRMAKHPEKREHTEEWMLIVACAVPLVLPILAAAAGAAAAGVGAVIGGIAGSEAGAALRAVCLLLIKKGAYALVEIVGFLRRFIKGDILLVLRDMKFAKYGEALAKYIGEFIGKLVHVIHKVRAELVKLDYFHWMSGMLAKLEALERGFYGVQTRAMSAIPKALAELDVRLQHVLAEALPHEPRLAHAGVPAPNVKPVKTEQVRVPAMPGNPLGHAKGTRVPGETTVPPQTNLHPDAPKKPRKPRQPRSTNANIDHTRTVKNADGSTTYFDKSGRTVTYNKEGYPDFSPYAEAETKINGLKGTIPPDDALANKAVGLTSTPEGYTWHHVEDGKTMQLVPTDLHATFPHSGGAAAIRNGP